ncbi:MAG UNVERIFIED_CONTAM: hypothetical protein LVQ98_02480 [Rickettsiaceae bacterium]|jgi:folate-binding Fe-S cluster repair protein YgfZ
MPPEYGAEELNAISYSKGCYVGQEVISRTKYQGEVRKKIYKISSTESLENIEYGTEIISKAKKIGILLSANNKYRHGPYKRSRFRRESDPTN